MAQTHKDRDGIAAANNAAWCAAVWRSHGLPVEQAHGMWFTRGAAPPLYPNVVTVDPSADPLEQAALISALAADLEDFSVKDSFACLPLEGAGFGRLFEARWFWRDRHPQADIRPDAVRWKRVESHDELEDWERAWRGVETAHAGIFRPALLADPRAIVMAGVDRSGVITAGGVGYEAADALGVTNIFGDAAGFLSALLPYGSTSRVVCYERGQDLRSAQQRRFEALGPLSVWARIDRTARPRQRSRDSSARR